MDTQGRKQRLSRQRKVILSELCKVTSHPTADEVYDMVRRVMPRISLGTVYRNLELLCSQGLAQKIGPAGAQKRFDGNAMPHPHLRCSVCSRVVDVDYPPELPELPEEHSHGFEVSGCSLEFVGLCPECRAMRQ
ncbi:MAG TPA: transcriptional repressor [Desulfovibrio sp.]|uniref:Fur family transcriptional regulator n=1 Tax=Desulfovibrio TaxID=872 RepID=UPI0004102847|nr:MULTISPECIES: transcriptional repressor [Desulfovibrio]MDY0307277.1 transcriptional repressor [Desulfovibrionaceae bacterium]HMM37648.1 transcriptional repressor [Desulfovibrio sp.]